MDRQIYAYYDDMFIINLLTVIYLYVFEKVNARKNIMLSGISRGSYSIQEVCERYWKQNVRGRLYCKSIELTAIFITKNNFYKRFD